MTTHDVIARNSVAPASFRDIVDAISRFTGDPVEVVEQRLFMELIDQGWNVRQDVGRYGVTPHMYNETMETLYREGTGFIYETLAYWVEPFRQTWTRSALDRLHLYASSNNKATKDVRVLMLGDGSGNDSIVLAQHGYIVDYFDVPGSKTYEFAVHQFENSGLLHSSIRLIQAYEQCLQQDYDVVISFEVLEHLVDPVSAIGDIRKMLKKDGIALITEGFWTFGAHVPTHLASNLRYAGRTPFLFLKHGLVLRWHAGNTTHRPAEYVAKHNSGKAIEFAKLLFQPDVLHRYLSLQFRYRLGRTP